MKKDQTNSSRLAADICENLCTKAMFIPRDDSDAGDDFPEEEPHSTGFWCALTQMPFGPDDEMVEPESCRPGRSCCVSRLPQE